jgi:acyl dehydratase
LHATLDGLDLDAYRSAVDGKHFADLSAPTTWIVDGGDSVTAATELARLSLNIAKAHTDPGSHHSGRRLVYGGHTIGIAAAQLTKVLPNLVTIIGWHHCNHLAPVFEGDVLRSTVHLEDSEALPGGGGLVTLRIEVSAQRDDGATDPVLDWRLVGAMA